MSHLVLRACDGVRRAFGKEKPRQFPAGGSLRLSSDQGSEGALGADTEGNGVLVLELVGYTGRLGRADSNRSDYTGVLLVEVGPEDFAREGQVLHWSPASNQADLGNVEVG